MVELVGTSPSISIGCDVLAVLVSCLCVNKKAVVANDELVQ